MKSNTYLQVIRADDEWKSEWGSRKGDRKGCSWGQALPAPGEWAIGGVQADGEIAVLVYNRDFATYALLADEDEGLYVFDLSSPTTVSGCFYERFGPESFSDCYPMTGVKTSSSTLTQSSLKRAQPNTTAAQPELDSMIIRVIEDLREDLREVLRQRGAYPGGMGGSGTF